MAAHLTLYTSTSLNEAMDLPVSVATDFFKSKSYRDWIKSRESENKNQVAVINRLNEVIRAIGILGKALSR